jgi:hypothetical protein
MPERTSRSKEWWIREKTMQDMMERLGTTARPIVWGGSFRAALLAVGLLVALPGCGDDPPEPDAATRIDVTPYLLAELPESAREVKAVYEGGAEDGGEDGGEVKGSEVVMVGRIGGSLDPWIDGRAAFNIVDRSVKACTDIPGDTCPTPWDYCCTRDGLPGAMALVKVVDSSGRLLAADARSLFGMKELQTVYVRGTASKDENGNLVVLATAVYVKK